MSEPTYPRKEPCPVCGEHEVDVVGPGDVWAICLRCHWELVADGIEPTTAEFERIELERDAAASRGDGREERR